MRTTLLVITICYYYSAGVGRTGTLITIQCMLEMIADTETLDIFNFVLGLRRQRSFMVQTEVHGLHYNCVSHSLVILSS